VDGAAVGDVELALRRDEEVRRGTWQLWQRLEPLAFASAVPTSLALSAPAPPWASDATPMLAVIGIEISPKRIGWDGLRHWHRW